MNKEGWIWKHVGQNEKEYERSLRRKRRRSSVKTQVERSVFRRLKGQFQKMKKSIIIQNFQTNYLRAKQIFRVS